MIDAKNISAGYGKTKIIDRVTCSFQKGTVTSVIGVNGSGKSTLIKALLGILPLNEGEIFIDGRPISEMKRIEVAKKLSYLPQGKNTPDMTVMQMVLHGRFPYLSYPRVYSQMDRDIAISAMERVGIASLASKPLYSLSGGMKQSAYIAMALAQETDYILLDEPTTHLDVSHQLALMRLLCSQRDQGKGIITIMHDLPLAFEFSDRICLLDKGRVILNDTPKNICNSNMIHQVFGIRIKFSNEENRFIYQY